MAIKAIEYDVDIAGISPATEQFAGTQGDHRVTRLDFTMTDELYAAITAAAASVTNGKALYRFDIYDGEGGIWSSEPTELTEQGVSVELEERHTRFGGRITVYLVITALSEENDTEVELYSFPAVLRLKNKPEGTAKEGENYESITALAETARQKAAEAAQSADNAANTVDEAVARLEETAKITFGKSAYQVAVENGFEGTESDWLASLKGEKGDTGPQGKQGVQGEQGAQGIQGVQGEKGDKGDAFTYDDLTDEQKADLKEGIEQCVADQAYDPTSENAQSGTAVAEALKPKMSKISGEGSPFFPRVIAIQRGTSTEEIAGTTYPKDSAYMYLNVDDGYSKGVFGSIEKAAGTIVARDSSTGNLWTGDPVDDEDCINYKYANQHFVRQTENIGGSSFVYARNESGYDEQIYTDRTDGYMSDSATEEGAISNGDFKEFGEYVARRQSNGNLVSGTPTKKYEVANKAYVDALKAENDEVDEGKVDKVAYDSAENLNGEYAFYTEEYYSKQSKLVKGAWGADPNTIPMRGGSGNINVGLTVWDSSINDTKIVTGNAVPYPYLDTVVSGLNASITKAQTTADNAETEANAKKITSAYTYDKYTLAWNSVYLITSSSGNADIELYNSATGAKVTDTDGKELPASKSCLLILPDSTDNRWTNNSKRCFFLGMTGTFSLANMNAATSRGFDISSGDLYFTPTSSGASIYKIGL